MHLQVSIALAAKEKSFFHFGRFLTYKICRRCNQFIKAEITKKKERENSRPVNEDLERLLQPWQGQAREDVLLRYSRARLLTIPVDDYLENKP